MTWRHRGEGKVELHLFLSSALRESKWSISHPVHFAPRERAPVNTEQEAEWGQELVWGFLRKYLAVTEIWTLHHPAESLLTTLTMLSWIHFYPVTFPIKLGSITTEETVPYFFHCSASLETLKKKHVDAQKWNDT